MKAGEEGSKEVRWYSGRMAREAPCEAAVRIWELACWKLVSGSLGCEGGNGRVDVRM